MASRYRFSKEEIGKIEQARKQNKNNRAVKRLLALELRAKGSSAKEVAEATGFHEASVSRLVAKYRDKGLEGITGNHYHGNRRNMSVEEEAAILEPFRTRAEQGERIETREIAAAYQEAVAHTVSRGQIYFVLHRHGWTKGTLGKRCPSKADCEVVEAS